MRQLTLIVTLLLLMVLSACQQVPDPALTTEPPAETVAELIEEQAAEEGEEAAEEAAAAAEEPTAVPPTAEPAEAGISAVPFNLGEAVLVQTGDVDESQREMPLKLNGLIAVPPQGDNLPLAIVLHGSHDVGCPFDGETAEWPCFDQEVQNFAGFDYLLEALAEHGYVAISPNLNAAYAPAYGELDDAMRLPILFDMYIQRLVAAGNGEDVDFGVDLNGRIDWNNIVMLGHSASGGHTVSLIAGRAGNTDPALIAAGQGPVSGAILLAPGSNASVDSRLDYPFAVILPACDRDLGSLPGQIYYERARLDPKHAYAAESIYIRGANHNRFNSTLGDDALGSATSACAAEDALLSAEQHRQFLADFSPRFFDAVLGRAEVDTAEIGFDAAQPAPDTLLGVQVLTSLLLPTDQRLTLDMPPEGASGALTAVACATGFAQEAENVERCGRLRLSFPANPQSLHLEWDGAGGVYEASLPDGGVDASQFDALHLRAVQDPLNELNMPGAPQAFSLRLTDGAGNSAEVALTDEPALTFPQGEIQDFGDSLHWDDKTLLSSIRVPLAAFESVDLSDIASLELLFDANERGAVFISDLEFLRSD